MLKCCFSASSIVVSGKTELIPLLFNFSLIVFRQTSSSFNRFVFSLISGAIKIKKEGFCTSTRLTQISSWLQINFQASVGWISHKIKIFWWSFISRKCKTSFSFSCSDERRVCFYSVSFYVCWISLWLRNTDAVSCCYWRNDSQINWYKNEL